MDPYDAIYFETYPARLGLAHYFEDILKNVSFSVKQHEKVAIVGASGSGKTTILKLLSGLYQPVKGDIKLNGYKLDYIDDCYFSKNIAFVPQNAFILNDTILNNVTFGDKSITESDVFNALDIVNLKNDVFILNKRAHALVHKYIKFDEGTKMFINKTNNTLIDSKEKHFKIMVNIFNENNVNYEIDKFPFDC